MSTSDDFIIHRGAHAVTKPNPDVVGVNRDEPETSSADALLHEASKFWVKSPYKRESRQVLFQSFKDMDQNGEALVPYKNGFVHGIIRAFQQDLHLVLRADDMWLVVMIQFSSYVNGHAEEMRELFVSHEGKKKLIVDVRPQSIATLDFQHIATLFAGLIQENVVDADLEDWMLPSFSTTTAADVGVAEMVMMATTKAYFDFMVRGGCGFPSVTLLGKREDWEHLLQKIRKLATYGEEVAAWAFCYWNESGMKTEQRGDKETDMSSGEEMDSWRLVVDDVAFPIIAASTIPRAMAEVPVTVQDYEAGIQYDTTLITGFVGVESMASKERGPKDTVQPRAGYWMLVDKTSRIPDDEI